MTKKVSSDECAHEVFPAWEDGFKAGKISFAKKVDGIMNSNIPPENKLIRLGLEVGIQLKEEIRK